MKVEIDTSVKTNILLLGLIPVLGEMITLLYRTMVTWFKLVGMEKSLSECLPGLETTALKARCNRSAFVLKTHYDGLKLRIDRVLMVLSIANERLKEHYPHLYEKK